jgi:trans-2,3-dihydro-3-hydroxyanthranilate isomerase
MLARPCAGERTRMDKPRFFITDVFTTKKYGGNPLATFVDCESLSDQEMQMIAKEINFSETTFITSRIPRNGGYDVKLFTPNAEVDFAGHPIIGTAHVIRNKLLQSSPDEIALNLRSGIISVTFSQSATSAQVFWMKQLTPQFGKQLEVNDLAPVLGIDKSDIDMSSPIEEISTGFPHIIVPLRNIDTLKRVRINKERYFALVNDAWAKLILVFIREGYEPSQNLSVRVFADFYGIPEDAATGSGNGCLAAYLVRHNLSGSPNLEVSVGQGYEMGRPSTLALRARNSNNGIEVFVGGSVVDVAEGVWG